MADRTVIADGTATLAQKAYDAIQDLIVDRSLPPGTMVSENRLCAELGLGRTPVREALQRLSLEGFLDIHSRRGALVTRADVSDQFELLELRRPLDKLSAELAAERATPDERDRMLRTGDALVDAAAAADRARYLRANRAVHDIRIASAHNEAMGRTLRVVFGLSRRFWYHHIESSNAFVRAANLHRDILGHAAAGAPEAAGAAADRFVAFLGELTEEALAHARRR